MSIHIHGTVLTHYGIAANNRGETEGNITTLQKIVWNRRLHTTVSAEAIRFALRYRWQKMYEMTGDESYRTNRIWDDREMKVVFEDPSFKDEGELFIDDDVMGYMDAKAAGAENETSNEVVEAGAKKGKTKPKGTTKARRGVLEVTRAVSLLPFLGETTFSARGGQKDSTSLYATEMHATSYQFGFSLTPGALKKAERAGYVVEAIGSLGTVGGNHGRFLYDFSPKSIMLRVTHDPAHRMLYLFEANEDGGITMPTLMERIVSGDVKAEELIVAGDAGKGEDAARLRESGVTVYPGIVEAVNKIKERLRL